MPTPYNTTPPSKARKLPPPPELTGKQPVEQARLIKDYFQKVYDAHGGVTVKSDQHAASITSLDASVAGLAPPGTTLGLANANVNGVSTRAAAEDHQHKRDVRVKKAAADVGTRNALNLADTASIQVTATDNAGADRVDVSAAAVGYPTAAGDILAHDGATPVRRSLAGDYCPVWLDPRENTKIGDGNRTPRGQPFEGTWYRGTTHIASGVAFPLFDVASPNAQDLMSFSLRYTAYWEDNGPSVQGEVGYVEVIAHRVGSVWAAGAVNMHDAKQSLSAGALTVAFTLDAGHDVAGAVDATKITVKATLTTTLGGTLVNAYLVWEMHDLFGPRTVTFAAMP